MTPFTSPRCATPRLLRPAQTLPVPTTAPTTGTHPVPGADDAHDGATRGRAGCHGLGWNKSKMVKQSAVGPGFKGSVVQVWAASLRKPSTFLNTSSTAQGGGGSLKNRKPIGEVGCCESGMAERSHWWTERCLRSPLFLSLSPTIYLPTYLPIYLSICLSMYLFIYRSISLSLSSI